jgi:hypothetical protein
MNDEDKAAIKAEIAEARRILREDKLLAHNRQMDERWTRIHGADPVVPPEGAPPAPEPGPPVPPAKDKPKGWWSAYSDE